MRKIHLAFALVFAASALSAQTLIVNINGETPTPLTDKTGTNTVTTSGTPLDTGGVVSFPSGSDYLVIDTLKSLDINGDWEVECKVKVADSTDELCIIDFRSTSLTGNMYFYYNRNDLGLHFGDRTYNDDDGFIVADSMLLPQNTWVTLKLKKEGLRFRIYRDGIVTADTTAADTLSPLAKTTIGYSEDRRVAHALYQIDDLKIWSNSTGTGIGNVENNLQFSIFPNPAQGSSYIRIASATQVAHSTLFNVSGELIRQSTSPEIFIGDLSAGTYLIEVKTVDGRNGVEQFVK